MTEIGPSVRLLRKTGSPSEPLILLVYQFFYNRSLNDIMTKGIVGISLNIYRFKLLYCNGMLFQLVHNYRRLHWWCLPKEKDHFNIWDHGPYVGNTGTFYRKETRLFDIGHGGMGNLTKVVRSYHYVETDRRIIVRVINIAFYT